MNRSTPLVTAEELQCLLADDHPLPAPQRPARLAQADSGWWATLLKRLMLRS